MNHNELITLLLITVFLLSGCTDKKGGSNTKLNYFQIENRTNLEKEFIGIKWGASKDELIRIMKERGVDSLKYPMEIDSLKLYDRIKILGGSYDSINVKDWIFLFNINRFSGVIINYHEKYDSLYDFLYFTHISRLYGPSTSHINGTNTECYCKYIINSIFMGYTCQLDRVSLAIHNRDIEKP